MVGTSRYFQLLLVVLAASALTGCSSQPATIVADDEAFCRYATATPSAPSGRTYEQCRAKVATERNRVAGNTATRIDGYALLQTPAPATETAGVCKDGSKTCGPGDVTGTIPAKPAAKDPQQVR